MYDPQVAPSAGITLQQHPEKQQNVIKQETEARHSHPGPFTPLHTHWHMISADRPP